MNYINTSTQQYPVTFDLLCLLFPNTSFPPGDFEPPAPYAVVHPSEPITCDPVTQQVVDGTPVFSGGKWVQGWQIIERFATLTERDAATAASQAATEANRVASLWQSAHDYEYAQVSGSAIGLLAMGVMTGKPKCIAVQNWIRGIWTEYYTRKAGTSTDTDFSIAELCPHTVPELMAELGF